MGMTPDNYFETFVFGNYEDCQQEKGNIRYAFNAAVSASHMADHYYTFYKKHDQSKIKQFKNLGDFVEYLQIKLMVVFKILEVSLMHTNIYIHLLIRKKQYTLQFLHLAWLRVFPLMTKDQNCRVLKRIGN